jgi:hypothetical protein
MTRRRHCLLPPPALRERGLARLGIALRRRAVFVVPEGERPHPRRADRRCVGLEDAADDDAVGEHAVVVIVPFAGWGGSPRRV